MITLQILNIQKNAPGKPQEAAPAKILEHLSLPTPIYGHRSYRQLEKHVQNLLKANEAVWYKH